MSFYVMFMWVKKRLCTYGETDKIIITNEWKKKSHSFFLNKLVSTPERTPFFYVHKSLEQIYWHKIVIWDIISLMWLYVCDK